jgi:hypothetical protein
VPPRSLLTVSLLVAATNKSIKRAVEPLEKAAAEERMKTGKGPDGSGGRGKKKNLGANDAKVKRAPQARDKVAKATGKKARTLAKAEAVGASPVGGGAQIKDALLVFSHALLALGGSNLASVHQIGRGGT